MNQNRISIWRALYGWIDQPKTILRYVIQEHRWPIWLAPALIVLLALIIVTAASAPFVSETARQQAEAQMQSQMGSLSGAQAEQMSSTLDTFTSPLFLAVTSVALAALGLALTWLFRGGVLVFISYLLGTEMKYIQMVTLVLWSWLPFALRDLVQAIHIVVNGQPALNRGLSFLVASSDQTQNAGNLLYGLLAQVDVFLLWHLLLLAIGITVSTRSTRERITLATLSYWAVTALIGLSPTVLGMLMRPALAG